MAAAAEPDSEWESIDRQIMEDSDIGIREANIPQVDKRLLQAAKNGDLDMVKKCVEDEHKASHVDAKDPNGMSAIHLATHDGHLGVVEYLVEKAGASMESLDVLGQTPLHLAAQRGHLDIVKYLVDHGAEKDSKDSLDGFTPLMRAASVGCLEAVDYLLERGADATIINRRGKSARDEAALMGKEAIVKLLDSPPRIDKKTAPKRVRRQVLPPMPPQSAWDICGAYKAHVLFFNDEKSYAKPNISVFNLIYSFDPEYFKNMGDETFQKTAYRWIHLPANNMKWVEHLVERLSWFDGIDKSRCDETKAFIKRHVLGYHVDNRDACFAHSIFHAEKLNSHKSAARRYPIQAGPQSTGRLAFIIPYFDMESKMSHEQAKAQKNQLEDTNPGPSYVPATAQSSAQAGGHREMADLRTKQNVLVTVDENIVEETNESVVLEQVYWKPSDLHVSQTLDRSYHLGLESTSMRDYDQVVWRYTSKRSEEWDAKNKAEVETRPIPSILMVNRLWLWRIDERTIIAAFPERLHKGDETANATLLKMLIRASNNSQLESLDDLIGLFALETIKFFDLPHNAGLQTSVFVIFAHAIAEMSNKAMEFHDNFEHFMEAVDPNSIRNEMKTLREVKDIRDEINMILSILHNQREVIQAMKPFAEKQRDEAEKRQFGDSPDNPWNDLINNTTISMLCDRMQRLDNDAERVEKSINHLLDLMQKQANIRAAISTLSQAEQATFQATQTASLTEEMKNQADETAKQTEAATQLGQIVSIFTIVTVIFTPLSFKTGLFALPISDQFPQSEGMEVSGNDFRKKDVAWWMTTGEIATVLILVAGIYGWTLYTRWRLKRRNLNTTQNPDDNDDGADSERKSQSSSSTTDLPKERVQPAKAAIARNDIPNSKAVDTPMRKGNTPSPKTSLGDHENSLFSPSLVRRVREKQRDLESQG